MDGGCEKLDKVLDETSSGDLGMKDFSFMVEVRELYWWFSYNNGEIVPKHPSGPGLNFIFD